MARRRVLVTAFLTAMLAVSAVSEAVGAAERSGRVQLAPGAGPASFRPDGWIKLCGQNLGCTIDPLPHPWLGKNIYNTTGRKQTVAVDINEGEGVRFWITLENDGSQADTFGVQGCSGNRTFEVNRVLLGKHKRQDAGATDLTKRYKRGTLTFDLDPGKRVVFTLNIITHFDKGVTYLCGTAVHSQNDPTALDTVVAKMTTF
jgi:hypothetical protein